MFKNCTILKLSPEAFALLWHAGLEETLKIAPSAEPDKTQWSRLGFASPSHFGKSGLVFENDRARVIYVEKQERVLPGKVIKQAVAARAAELERRDGHKPTRKVLAQIKDDVISELLPGSHVKINGLHVMFDRDYLYIESPSGKMADEVVSLLANVMAVAADQLDSYDAPGGPLPVFLVNSQNARAMLKDIALREGGGNEKLSRGESAVVEGHERSIARFRDCYLGDNEVQSIIADGAVRELAVSFKSDPGQESPDLHCVVTDTLVLKRIKFADVHLKQAEDDGGDSAVSMFDATSIIVISLLRRALNSLVISMSRFEEDEL